MKFELLRYRAISPDHAVFADNSQGSILPFVMCNQSTLQSIAVKFEYSDLAPSGNSLIYGHFRSGIQNQSKIVELVLLRVK